jgi:hypothetical protein
MTLGALLPDNITATTPGTAHIVVPYIPGMLHQETIDVVCGTGLPVTFQIIHEDDPYEYGRVFASWWNRGQDLIWVEQDVAPDGLFARRFQVCDRPWCTHQYPCDTNPFVYGLGVCRFTSKMQATAPGLGEQAAKDHTLRPYTMHWTALNERVITLALHFGFKPHVHAPVAGHLHDYESERPRAADVDQ